MRAAVRAEGPTAADIWLCMRKHEEAAHSEGKDFMKKEGERWGAIVWEESEETARSLYL